MPKVTNQLGSFIMGPILMLCGVLFGIGGIGVIVQGKDDAIVGVVMIVLGIGSFIFGREIFFEG